MRVTTLRDAGTLRRASTAVTAAALWIASAASAAPGTSPRFAGSIDGLVTHAEELRTRAPVEHVLARLRTEWRAEHPDSPAIDSRVGGTRVLGQRVDRSYRVAQLTELGDGTTRVVLSTRALDPAARSAPAALPLPTGHRVIRRLEMDRERLPVVQVYALAAESPRLAELRFDATARRAGWDPAPVQHRRLGTAVRAWRRGADELLVVTTPIGTGTGLLLHLAPHAATGDAR